MHSDLCICDRLVPLPVRTRLVLITHSAEHQKPSNTGHLAVACLEQAQEIVRGTKNDEPLPLLWERTTTPLLLFPTPDAILLTDWIKAQPTPTPAVTLIVPDGTWRQCKRVRRRVPTIEQATPITLPFTTPSEYRLRHAPKANQLSTLEAIARAMGFLEGPSVEQHLMSVFRIAVERTLWTNGRLSNEEIVNGIPEGASQHGPRPKALEMNARSLS
jgi:DTW domain-containing protein YfiP